jgi:Rrf2 family cysteine metabolism transcriptional repressor
MNISVKSEYALQAIFDLAEQAEAGEPVKIAAIAKRWKIPQKFLELILAGLKQNGFVESRRGAEGGYLLARPAQSITVGEVLRAVERLSNHNPDDPFTAMWAQVDAALSGVLDRTSFADLVRDWREKQTAYVPNWDI